jgi:tol-pal system protein YbgF
MKRCWLLLICFTPVFTVGCIPLNSQEATDLRVEISQLQIQYRELQQNHADLYAKIDSAYTTLDILNAAIQDLQNKEAVLNQNIYDLKTSIANNPKDKQGESLLPSSLYQSAYGDYSMGKFELAYSGFQSFLDKYPNAKLAVQAQFYIGECFYSLGMWEKALNEYKKVEQQYKKTYLVPSARLKIALCYELLSKNSEAIKIFSSIVKDFPETSESLTAKEKLKIYDNAKER